MTSLENHRPLWTQDQAIAFEAALEAVNDVIAGYSEQIADEQASPAPNAARIAWLEMHTDQAAAVMDSLNVTDIANVHHVLSEYSAIVRASDAAASFPADLCPGAEWHRSGNTDHERAACCLHHVLGYGSEAVDT